jgi:hypothetical protein
MLDLCIFAMIKRLIFRANKLEKANLQSDHIVRILDGFIITVVPRNVVESFQNAGVLLMLNDDRILCCRVTPETVHCLLETLFADPLVGLELGDEDEEDGDLDLEIFAARVLGRLIHEETEKGEGNVRGMCVWRGCAKESHNLELTHFENYWNYVDRQSRLVLFRDLE